MRIHHLVLICCSALACAADATAAEPTPAQQQAAALADIGRLMAAMGYLQADCGGLPSDMQGLGALLADPGFKGWNGPYIQGKLPVDPWKSPYRYQLTKDDYELRSAGPDQKFGTADDITPSKPKK